MNFVWEMICPLEGEGSGPKTLNKLIRQLQKASGVQQSQPSVPVQLSKDLHSALQLATTEADLQKALSLATELTAMVDVEAALRDNLLGIEEEGAEPDKVAEAASKSPAVLSQKATEGYKKILAALIEVLPIAFAKDSQILKVFSFD